MKYKWFEIKYRVCEPVYRLLQGIARTTDKLSQRFAYCNICGRNRYTGEACGGKRESTI